MGLLQLTICSTRSHVYRSCLGKVKSELCLNLSHGQIRTVIMAPPTKSNKRIKKQVRSRANDIWDIKRKLDSKVLSDKLQKLQELTKNLKLEMKKQEELEVLKEVDYKHDQDLHNNDDELIFNDLMIDDKNDNRSYLIPDSKASVFLFDTPAHGITFTPTFTERLGDNIKYLASREHQHWSVLISKLNSDTEGFKGLSHYDVVQFLNQIPLGALDLKSAQIVDKMIQESELKMTIPIYDFLMKHYSVCKRSSDTQRLFNHAVENGITPTKFMYGHLIKAFTHDQNTHQIDVTLRKMLDNGIEPGLVIYTNILKLCVQIKDIPQAESIFQMLKFRSLQTKPDIHAYNTMIQLYCNDKNLLKALDLYEELLSGGLKPNLFTFENLAKVCSKSSRHLRKGWDFIIEIYKRGLEPTIKTFEVMLRLSAKDGDLELSRAIYLKIAELEPRANDIESFIYLLMAYRDFNFSHEPQILNHEAAFRVRENLINMVDFVNYQNKFIIDDPVLNKVQENCPPFLPLRRLATKRQIIAESNAIWSFYLMRNSKYLQPNTIVIFLSIAINHGDITEYRRRLEDFTCADYDIVQNRIIIEEAFGDDSNQSHEQHKKPIQSLSPAYERVKQDILRISRTSPIYVNMVAASRRFNNEEISEEAWRERGLYRKTPRYQSLHKDRRVAHDFRFALEIVSAFTVMDNLYDAVSIVKSTQNQFDWSYYHLKPLHLKLIDIGDIKTAAEVSKICGSTKIIKNY